ncbi:meiotic recombination protein REC8 homolog [Centropristis striata]|uniref:meiotic recombination protein REC8 homolog n=1 Tax=Centropristis striata TaxID=184440 RepID=UPI0027E17195|nr:meiotic recombination protein REC8 homolog [Centropristis striata]
MFYYPAVLRRHSGCFSTIWLVATKGTRVTRRDFLKVNVIRTCDDIMNYVLERVPPPQPGLPKPRFSLYLSSQLQYGVILVYHRQCALFLQELQSVVGQLLKKSMSQKIDMDDSSRQPLDLPDALAHLDETEGALDPFFGVMHMRDAMPSPNTLIQRGQEYVREADAAAAAAAALENGITASPDSITLREREPVTIPAAEFEGEELFDQHQDTIDLLMAQTDDFPEGDVALPREEVIPGEQEGEMEIDRRGPEIERTKDRTGSTIELQPTTLSSEGPGLSVEKPGPPSDQHTPVSGPGISYLPSAAVEEWEGPAPQSEDVTPPAVKTRRKRKRQLIFFDPETQILEEVLQQQINNPVIETRPLIFPPAPSKRMPSAAELFNRPCTPLPEEVEFLWRQAATIQPLLDSDLPVGERGPESTDSEREREREMAEAAEAAEADEAHELPEIPEISRDVAGSVMFDISEHGSLEASDLREASREIISPMFTPEREGPPVPRSAGLQDIPEVAEDELLETPAAESPRLLPDLPVLFQSLLPPDADRRTVSNMFQRLLVTLSARELHVEQREPYGDILIFPGPNYEEGRLSL